MREVLWSVFFVGLVLVLTASVATAEKQFSKEPIETIVPTPFSLAPSGAQYDCQVGNLNPAAWAIGNFIAPPEEYKLVFDPLATCTACPFGFQVQEVHVHLQTDAACTIIMGVDVEVVTYDPSGCTTPGPEICNSGLYQVDLPSAGGWLIGIPIDCHCITILQKCLLSLYLESTTCSPVPDLVTDAGPPLLCTNWNNWGVGWFDLVAQYPGGAWPGQLKFWADAVCCSPPTPVEAETWGKVKCLFR
ncbi:MAG: hypothetical protein AMJ46_03920 [Latescibacteria bacterium DG_63]|nr:MAG: hypothetical protein AMJ46_03920 [Latescibacteria bacterium DG_63]